MIPYVHSSRIALIGAHTAVHHAFGLGSGMPWPRGSLKEDMRRFKSITSEAPVGKKNLVIVDRATAEALTDAGKRTLPNRVVMGISRSVNGVHVKESDFMLIPSAEAGLIHAARMPEIHNVFFAGGKVSWEAGLQHASHAYLSVVHKESDDTGLHCLEKPLHEMVVASGFVIISQQAVLSEWDGEVRVDFLDYFRHME